MPAEPRAFHITVRGTVQGVGFRPFVYRLANELGLAGWVQNRSGDVTIHIEGEDGAVDRFQERLAAELPPLARIDHLAVAQAPATAVDGFTIRRSEGEGGHQPVSPDVATCAACSAELLDPSDRRYLYPFINCTDCGPRYTIIERVPYDRGNTTMQGFAMCDYCRSQYEDPGDRRFHAQPVACPVCGPRIWLEEGDGVSSGAAGDVIRAAAGVLRSGGVLALKGLGGFHLAVDATFDAAVAALRERKGRPHKALAVMVADVEAASSLCAVSETASLLLSSPAAPIVLLPLRQDTEPVLSSHIAPDHGSVGVMLPYTPLHLLLLREYGGPLVMTSGNLSDEPLAVDNTEARRRLSAMADAFLMHDRPIHMPCDDSVMDLCDVGAREGESPLLVRRARGYAPSPLRLPLAGPQVLGVGPEMKATVALARDEYAYVSQHLGDLDNACTEDHFHRVVAQFEDLFSVEPEAIAHDLHPDFFSTRYAQDRASREGQLLIPVQHHHAHALSCIAENDAALLEEPVVAVVLDGTGYGTDGSIWGGEWLIVAGATAERCAHLQYVPLVGGDAAVRRVDRLALAYLMALGLADRVPGQGLLTGIAPEERELLRAGLQSPWTVRTSSMGRLFDVVAALLGLASEVTYEAQAAIRLQTLAERAAGGAQEPLSYPWRREGEQVIVSDLLAAVLDDREAGRSLEQVALAFHHSVAEMVVAGAEAMAQSVNTRNVALSGGCFQNRLLTSLCVRALRARGLTPRTHRALPPNDGCVSLGQVVAARLLHR